MRYELGYERDSFVASLPGEQSIEADNDNASAPQALSRSTKRRKNKMNKPLLTFLLTILLISMLILAPAETHVVASDSPPPDYPLAEWIESPNYTPGEERDIEYIVIHVMEGYFEGTISWFQNEASGVSAHYLVSQTGELVQMVREKDIAWHAGNLEYNQRSIGIEHEDKLKWDEPDWATEELYQSSAALVRYLCAKYDIPKDRTHIIGHNEVPGVTKPCPGPYWDWDYFMGLVQGDPSSECSVTRSHSSDFSGRYNVPATCFTDSGWAIPVPADDDGNLETHTNYDYDSPVYLSNHGFRHGGVDWVGPYSNPYDTSTPVYAIGNGTIRHLVRDYSPTTNNSRLHIEHTAANGAKFLAIYGHTYALSSLSVGNAVSKGQQIGALRQYGSPIHLHFELNTILTTTSYGAVKEGTVNPLQFLIDNPGESASPPSIAVTPRSFDRMQDVLDAMGYEYTEIPLVTLTDLAALQAYDVVFINCAGTYSPISATFGPIREFVSQGGAVYASDFAFAYIQGAFPGYVDFGGYVGPGQTTTGHIHDDGLKTYVGAETLSLVYDLGGWVPVTSVSDDVTTYVSHTVSYGGASHPNTPAVVGFRYGQGHVIYTSFHNAAQDQLARKLMEYLVLIPVSGDIKAALEDSIEEKGYDVDATFVNAFGEGETKSYSYSLTEKANLVVGVNWAGSVVTLSVMGPDGTTYGPVSSSSPPLFIEVPGATPGLWTMTVTGNELPYTNYPIVLMLGSIPTPTISSSLELDPDTMNLQARAKWITAYIELPEGYAAEDIDMGTVRLLCNGSELYADWGEVQDGVLMVKFDWATVAGWFEGLHDEEVELTVAGEVDGVEFEGTDTIRVIDPPRPGTGPTQAYYAIPLYFVDPCRPRARWPLGDSG